MRHTFNNKKLKSYRSKLRSSMTDAEVMLWKYISGGKLMGYRFRRQYSVGKYILDFYCPHLRLAIELDGGRHNEPKNMKADKERTKFLEGYNIRVIRYWDNDVLNNIDGVFDDLINQLEKINK